MQILHSEQEFPAAASVLALGTFDGVHIGHMALIRRAKVLALELDASCIVCTFDRHPLSVLDPNHAPNQLTTSEEKRNKIAMLGADFMLVKPFTPVLSSMPAKEYLLDLVRSLHAKAVVVGENHRFGRRGEGDAQLIRVLSKQYGFIAEIVPPVYDGSDIVSSSLIRTLLASGQKDRAMRLLSIQSTP